MRKIEHPDSVCHEKFDVTDVIGVHVHVCTHTNDTRMTHERTLPCMDVTAALSKQSLRPTLLPALVLALHLLW